MLCVFESMSGKGRALDSLHVIEARRMAPGRLREIITINARAVLRSPTRRRRRRRPQWTSNRSKDVFNSKRIPLHSAIETRVGQGFDYRPLLQS
jgi:hypothetical protein